jgi:hypothetical protein
MLLKHNNNSISNVTSFAQIPAGEPVLLSTATASSSASISFNSTYINSDYKIYKFEFIDIHPQNTGNTDFVFQTSTNNGSSYGVTCTSTYFTAYHLENDSGAGLTYDAGGALAQSTAFQRLADNLSNNNDASVSGNLFLFNPSSSVFVKHFIGRTNAMAENPLSYDGYSAGYFNTTSVVNAINFKFSSGNIDAGQIKLYGIGAN